MQYTFRTGVYNTVSDQSLLDYLSKNTSMKTLGLIYSNDATGQSIDADLKSLAPQYGIAHLGAQYFNTGAQSMLPQVKALMSADAIFISGNSTDAGATAISAQQAGYKGMLVGNNGLRGFTYVESAGAAANGTVFSSNNLAYETDTPANQWPAAYRFSGVLSERAIMLPVLRSGMHYAWIISTLAVALILESMYEKVFSSTVLHPDPYVSGAVHVLGAAIDDQMLLVIGSAFVVMLAYEQFLGRTGLRPSHPGHCARPRNRIEPGH